MKTLGDYSWLKEHSRNIQTFKKFPPQPLKTWYSCFRSLSSSPYVIWYLCVKLVYFPFKAKLFIQHWCIKLFGILHVEWKRRFKHVYIHQTKVWIKDLACAVCAALCLRLWGILGIKYGDNACGGDPRRPRWRRPENCWHHLFSHMCLYVNRQTRVLAYTQCNNSL